MVHILKIQPGFLSRILDGTKKSEVRLNDRDFQVGDVVRLHKFNGRRRSVEASTYYKIDHIHHGLGLAEGYVCLSFTLLKKR